MPTTFRPLHDRVLIKRIASDDTTPGGLYIPEKGRERPTHAHVVAVGSGRVLENGKLVECAVKPGDLVVVGKWSGDVLRLDDVEHLVVKESEVLGVLE